VSYELTCTLLRSWVAARERQTTESLMQLDPRRQSFLRGPGPPNKHLQLTKARLPAAAAAPYLLAE